MTPKLAARPGLPDAIGKSPKNPFEKRQNALGSAFSRSVGGYNANQVGVHQQAGPTMAFINPVPQPHVLIHTNGSMVGPLPCQIKCPACQATVITRITSNPGGMAWLIGLGLCLVG